MVCVAINYRMGIDGFLPIPGIPTNFGLRDMVAALIWVQENISAFGGDTYQCHALRRIRRRSCNCRPRHLPLARGLFGRAIIESGHGGMVRDFEVARRLVRKLARILKIEPKAEGFATVTPERAWLAIGGSRTF